MGLHSRSYMVEQRFSLDVRVLLWLIGLTVAAFLVQDFLLMREGIDLAPVLGVQPQRLVRGWVWQLFTHVFVHATGDVWHVAFNMLALYWLGADVARIYGAGRFLFLYFGGAAGCAILYTAISYLNGTPHSVAVGASGAVFAVAVVAAFLFPSRTIYLFWFVPTPLWVAVLIYIAADVYIVVSGIQTGVASAGHLGGAIFGALAHKLEWDGSWLGRLASRFRLPTTTRAPMSRSSPEVDRILDKINAQGIGSLTDEERETLKRAARE